MDYRKRKRRRHTFNVPGDAHELTFSCCHGLREHAASESNGCSGNRAAAGNRNITQPKTLLGMIDYIHLNPGGDMGSGLDF